MGRVDEPLIAAKHFEYKNRPYRDTFATISLVVASVLVLAGGLYGVSNRDQRFFHKISDDYLGAPDNCPADGLGRNLLGDDSGDGGDDVPFAAAYFFTWLGPWILMSVGFSIAIGVLLVHLFRTNARKMINVALGMMLGVWVVYGLLFLLSGSLPLMGLSFGFLALYGFIFYRWSTTDKLSLMAQLLSVTSTGLQQNARIAFLPIITPIVLTFMGLPIVLLIGAAGMNGRVVRDSDVQLLPDGTCQDTEGNAANCCTWAPDAWVPPYVFFAGLFFSWLTFLGDQIKTFAISGTIAQWYFSPVGTSTSGNLSRSLNHAFTTSFGSLSLSSAILAIVNYIRQLAENARQRRSGNFALLILSCLAGCFYNLVQFITKFATIRMAIKGEAFFTAASSVTGLLSRNFLSTIAVWWLPPAFLGMYTITISLAWGVCVGLINFFASGQDVASGVIMGVIAFLLCVVVLSFITGLMMQVVDTVYICYALELDEQTCTKPEVHEVFNSIPRPTPVPGDVVENPDGNFAYAQPVGEQQPLLAPATPPSANTPSQV